MDEKKPSIQRKQQEKLYSINHHLIQQQVKVPI